MLERLRNRPYGPVDKAIAVALGLALILGLGYVALRAFPDGCGDGLEEIGGECVGVTASVLPTSGELDGLVQAVADENARVERDWEAPKNGRARVPYVRVALMMPFTADATSAMTMGQIKHALTGAHVAQLRANQQSGPRFQLLLANDGKDLNHWRPVVDRLAGMVGGPSPLVGAIGMPSSTPETLRAVNALSVHRIPAIGPVITSADMNAKYFFKTSPSNEHFAQVLREFLAEKPGPRKGFLVADSREQDIYSRNLRGVFMKHFAGEYGLRRRLAYFLGVTGEDQGIPQRFSSAAQKICVSGADTVFFAGRDQDLPHFVNRLADEPSCDSSTPVRVLKVGIGVDPLLSTPQMIQRMRNAGITLVHAASVDPHWWQSNEQSPAGLAGFLDQFRDLGKKRNLGDRPLEDGYAIMYHDAFTVLSQAVDQAFNEASDNGTKDGKAPVLPKRDDVYNSIINMNITGTKDGANCVNCIDGASGKFGFDDSPDTNKWPVCKPVPVVEYPEPSGGAGAAKKNRQPYRTHQNIFNGACP